MPGLLIAEGKVIPADFEFDRIAHGRPANDFHLGAIAEAHFKQSSADFGVAAHGKHMPAAPDAELVQAAGVGRTAMIARRKSTSFLHVGHSQSETSSAILSQLRLSFNEIRSLVNGVISTTGRPNRFHGQYSPRTGEVAIGRFPTLTSENGRGEAVVVPN